jgi:hypothetical protein
MLFSLRITVLLQQAAVARPGQRGPQEEGGDSKHIERGEQMRTAHTRAVRDTKVMTPTGPSAKILWREWHDSNPANFRDIPCAPQERM